jgi:23S rRNA (uracil1939-C5)-methyltransferase
MDGSCPHLPNCVGCAFIGRPYGEQLRLKSERVRALLASSSALAKVDVPDAIGSPRVFGYRNQAKLVVRRARRGLLLGIYRPGTHQVVDIRECPVHHPLATRALAAVAEVFETLHIPAYDERSGKGGVRYVVVRVSQWRKRAQVIIVSRQRELPRLRELVRRLRAVPGVSSVVLNVNADPGNVIFGSEFVPLGGDAGLVERVGDFKLKTRPGSFLQANISVARRIYELVLRWAAPEAEDVAVDLYSGVGALSFFLATRARAVFGIEESPIAVADAKGNTRLNGFHNVRFEAGDVATLFPRLCRQLDRVDLVTVNPPRKGVDAATRAAIVESGARRVVYVSCDPVTLVRDLEWFAAHGYSLARVQPFDLLPQTEHVECVAELVQGPGS